VKVKVVDNLNNTKLIEAALNGDIESFGKLCKINYASMVAVAYAITGDSQLAEDAAQETFARALTQLKKLRNTKKFVPWLASICRNVAKDIAAKKQRQIKSKEQNLQYKGDCNNHEYAARRIRKAIAQLPANYKEIIVLRYYDGLSYEEITSVLGLSKAGINGRLTRAKRKLAKKLKQYNFAEKLL